MLVPSLAVTLVVCLLAFTSCGHRHTRHLEATVDRDATCTEAGQKSIKCIDCTEIKEGSVVTIPATLYIDGVMASSYAYEPGYETNLLYTAELVGGNLEYDDVDGGWLYLFRMGDSATENGQNSYVVLGDISMTVGDCFVLDVEPVENPTAGTYTIGGETLDGTVHCRVK